MASKLEIMKDEQEEQELNEQLLQLQKEGKLSDAKQQMSGGYEPPSKEGQEQEGSEADPNPAERSSSSGSSEGGEAPPAQDEGDEDTRQAGSDDGQDTGHQETDTQTAGQGDNWRERYVEIQRWATQVSQQNKELLEQLRRDREQPTNAQTQEQKAEEEARKAEREEILRQFREDYPEAAEYTDTYVAELVEARLREADEKLKPLNARMEEIDSNLFINKVISAHDDAGEIYNDPAFAQYLQARGEEAQFIDDYNSRKADKVIAKFQEFKDGRELLRLREENKRIRNQLSTYEGAGNEARDAAEQQRRRDAANALEDNRSGSRGGARPSGRSKARTWTRSEIERMSEADYASHQADIDKAMIEGRIVDDR